MPVAAGLNRAARRLVARIAVALAPVRWKQFHELAYWKGRKRAEGELANSHYRRFCTAHFGLEESFYRHKVILDVGCGPRGSLEWASMAARRIGVDPLAEKYLRLGAGRHRMEYLCAPAEAIPLGDGECDVVFSFNSLDHVENVDRTVKEIKRITRPGGLFLLLVEVNHPPTDCEPHDLTPAGIIDLLKPEFSTHDLRVFRLAAGGIYASIDAGHLVTPPESTREKGYLSARFVRNADADQRG